MKQSAIGDVKHDWNVKIIDINNEKFILLNQSTIESTVVSKLDLKWR